MRDETDDYFHIPDDVNEGGLTGALDRGDKWVPLSSLLYHLADESTNLGRADRIHFFVMLMGGGSKAASDQIEDVQFELDGTQLVAKVHLERTTKEVRCTVVLGGDNERQG